MKTHLFSLIKLCAVFCTCVLIAFVLITAVYALPSEAVCANVSASGQIFADEGSYTASFLGLQFSVLDNATDALMLSAAAYSGKGVEVAMLNSYYSIPGQNNVDSLLCIYPGGEIERAAVNNYARYWHGYLVFLKPLLMLTDYSGVRTVLTLTQLGLVLLIMLLLYLRRHTRFILPVFILYLFLCPMALKKSLQFNTVFMLCYLQLLLVLLFPRLYADRRFWTFHFLVAGCAAGYLDFLTFPLLSFGVPLLFMLSLCPDRPIKDFFTSIKAFIAWGCGYIGIMASKWLIASFITGTDVVSDAVNSLLVRSGGLPEQISSATELRFAAISKNLATARQPLSVILALAAVYIVFCLLKHRKTGIGRLGIYFAFAVAPFLWYLLLANHSYYHAFFTFRNLGITVFAVLMLCAELTPQKTSISA